MNRALARFLAVFALGALACAQSAPGLPPPGLDGKAPRLFYPVGLAVSKDGTQLYVANSNFDRAFNGGSIVRFPTALFDQAAALPGARLAALPADAPVARLDSFAGPVRLNAAGTALFVTTRDNDTLTRIPLDAAGAFQCDPAKGCSAGAVHLGSLAMTDPFALVLADVVFPGATAAEPAVLVSHLSPESTGTGTTAKDAFLAVVPERLASDAQKPFENGAFRVDLGVLGSDALAFDPTARRLFVGGCFQRTAAAQGDLVVVCGSNPDSSVARTNPLRSLLPEAGPSSTVDQVNLGQILGGADTVDLALASPVGATASRLLYVATSRPSALITVEIPAPGQVLPQVRTVTPLASAPSRLHVLRRPTGDLVVVTATASNAVLVVDPIAGQVLAQLAPLGVGPYELASTPTATGDRVFVGLFNDCAVAAIDVPTDKPFDAKLVGIVGGCP